jgi:xanthine dehydrogenase YagT iron-sulfur-binding subunit
MPPMAEEQSVTFELNGRAVTLTVPVRLLLTDALRDDLGLTGTHVGCEHGACGACTVLINGQAARACLMLAVQADGLRVETIEGLHARGAIRHLQEAFTRHHALQCGYCTPGMLVTAYDLLTRGTQLTEADIREGMSASLCRCTGYAGIIAAVAEVADRHVEETPP